MPNYTDPLTQVLREAKYDSLKFLHGNLEDILIDPKALQHMCPLENEPNRTKRARNPTVPLHSLGDMDMLPLEIINMILGDLDIEILMRVIAVNKRGRQLVETLPPFKTVQIKAPTAIRAMLTTNIARYFTIGHLFDALQSQACSGCGKFGGFLYLPTCSRCCFRCLSRSSKFSMLPISMATEKSNLQCPEIPASLPVLSTVPKSRFFGQNVTFDRVKLIDTTSLRNLKVDSTSCTTSKPEEEGKVGQGNGNEGKLRQGDEGEGSVGPGDEEEGRVGSRIAEESEEAKGEEDEFKSVSALRFMAAIRFPSFNVKSGIFEKGVSCGACYAYWDMADLYDYNKTQHLDLPMFERLEFPMFHHVELPMFTKEELAAHLGKCDLARFAWVHRIKPKLEITPRTKEGWIRFDSFQEEIEVRGGSVALARQEILRRSASYMSRHPPKPATSGFFG